MCGKSLSSSTLSVYGLEIVGAFSWAKPRVLGTSISVPLLPAHLVPQGVSHISRPAENPEHHPTYDTASNTQGTPKVKEQHYALLVSLIAHGVWISVIEN
jgi:hypothetical protein